LILGYLNEAGEGGLDERPGLIWTEARLSTTISRKETAMDVHRLIVELRAELQLIDDTILSFERLASANHETGETQTKRRPARRAKETGESLGEGNAC